MEAASDLEYRTFEPLGDRVEFAKAEEETLETWLKNKTFEKSIELTRDCPAFTFYDGPPFATGLPHYGHLLISTVKDVIGRYATQTGHYVERRFGWDCHGLPVEFEQDKKFNVSSRQDVIQRIGVHNYNEACRSVVMTYAQEWRQVINRLGRWVDFDNDYKTMNPSFMESVWWVFKQLFDKGLVYRDHKVMPYSTACSTPISNFEANQNYKDVSDPSIVITFPIVSSPCARIMEPSPASSVCFLAWTTTPWTLPSNLGLCVNANFNYLKVMFPKKHSQMQFVLAEDRLPWLLKELGITLAEEQYVKKGDGDAAPVGDGENLIILERDIKGSELVDSKYIPPFDFYSKSHYWQTRAFKVLADDYVTGDTGVGIVHQAPAFGEEDFNVCMKHGLIERGGDIPCPVDDSGRFMCPVDDPMLIGVHVKEADKEIRKQLKGRGRLIVDGQIIHSYPLCWRSDTPLIYKAVRSWFVKVEAIKDTLVQNNKETYWVPQAIQTKRFHNWLTDARDWCISRNRFWGTPIPLWVSQDYTQIVCIGSISELQQYTDKKLTDIHKHFVDDIEIPDPRGPEYPKLRRVEEIFDCWFESGSMPYAQLHYPFENSERFKSVFPADYIGEGLDQTRGWFYTLSIISAALFGTAPFKNVVVNGLVLAEDGRKMSKRLNNYPDPVHIFNTYGADALRLYLISSPVVRAESLRFRESGVKDIMKGVFLPLFNAYKFLVQEIGRYEKSAKTKFVLIDDSEQRNEVDEWIMSLAHSLIKFFHQEMEAYRLYTSLPKVLQFLEMLTNWYVRLNRERMRGNPNAPECRTSLTVLFNVLFTLIKLLSPFTPFLSELIYKNLRNALPLGHPERMDSIHFLRLPVAREDLIKKDAEFVMSKLQSVIVLGRLMREKRKVSMKRPLASLTVICENKDLVKSLSDLETYIKDELNVMELSFSCQSGRVSIAAVPNYRQLGERLGKALPAIAKEIKQMDELTLKKLSMSQIDEVTLAGHKLTRDDFVFKTIAVGFTDDQTTAFECDSEFVVVADFTMDSNLENLALARQVVNKIQKMRKQCGLTIEDEVITIARAKNPDGSLGNVLNTHKETIKTLLRRDFNDEPNYQKLTPKYSEEFEINDEEILCVEFYQK